MFLKPILTKTSLVLFMFCFIAGFPPFTTQSGVLMTLMEDPVKNIMGKGENAGNRSFLIFPQCFLPYSRQVVLFDNHLNCQLLFANAW